MKVLHINSYYSNRFFYKNLYNSQINQDIELNVYVPVANNFEKPNIELGSYTKISKNHGKYDRAIFQVKHQKILKDIKQKYELKNFQLLHAHSLFSNGFIAYKVYEEFEVPYIVTVRNTDLNTFFKYMIHLRRLGIKILLNSQKIIFLSTSLRDELIEKYIPNELKAEIKRKSAIIPNGIDPFWLENKNQPKQLVNKKEIRIIQVGIINNVKNPLMTCKAIEVLNNRGYKVKLDVIGKVENQRVFNELVEKKFVTYHPPMPKEKLLKKYRENDIFVLPSLQETFGLVYAEAISQGLPVLYSKGQGFDNQFPDGQVGFAINKRDEVDIAEKIIDILNNYDFLSKNDVRLVDKFDWNRISGEFIQIYNDILNN